MEILWRDGEVKSSSVTAELEKCKGWAKETVRTFLKRLILKGIAAARQDDGDKRVFWYYATISKEEYISRLTKNHLMQYYNGRLPQLMAGLMEDETISEDELNQIELLLKQHTRNSIKGEKS